MGKDFLDLQKVIANESHWVKLPYIPSDIKAIIDFITSTAKPTTTSNLERWTKHPFSLTTIVLVATTAALIIVLFRAAKPADLARSLL
ncbi:unnamed protein product, partial [Adineta steineri]